MFRVTIERSTSDSTKVQRLDVVMKTEKLYEIIGRFTLLYGPPILTDNVHGIREAEYFKDVGRGYESACVVFAKIAADNNTTKKTKNLNEKSWHKREPVVVLSPPPPPEPNEERIDELLKAGVIETSYSNY